MSELVTNAVEALEPEEFLTVSVETTSALVTVTVINRGTSEQLVDLHGASHTTMSGPLPGRDRGLGIILTLADAVEVSETGAADNRQLEVAASFEL